MIVLDTREFQATLRQYLTWSKSTLPKVLNTKAFFIARGATVQTYKVPREKIEHQMGVVGNEVKLRARGKKAGTFRKGKWILGDTRSSNSLSFAERIVLKRWRDSGVNINALPRETLQDDARRMIKARIASRGFIASGWIPAIKLLAAFVYKERGQKQDPSVKLKAKQPMGGAIPAKRGVKIWVEIWNQALAMKGDSTNKEAALQKYASEGLQKSINLEVASMKQYMERKMQDLTNRVAKSILR